MKTKRRNETNERKLNIPKRMNDDGRSLDYDTTIIFLFSFFHSFFFSIGFVKSNERTNKRKTNKTLPYLLGKQIVGDSSQSKAHRWQQCACGYVCVALGLLLLCKFTRRAAITQTDKLIIFETIDDHHCDSSFLHILFLVFFLLFFLSYFFLSNFLLPRFLFSYF